MNLIKFFLILIIFFFDNFIKTKSKTNINKNTNEFKLIFEYFLSGPKEIALLLVNKPPSTNLTFISYTGKIKKMDSYLFADKKELNENEDQYQPGIKQENEKDFQEDGNKDNLYNVDYNNFKKNKEDFLNKRKREDDEYNEPGNNYDDLFDYDLNNPAFINEKKEEQNMSGSNNKISEYNRLDYDNEFRPPMPYRNPHSFPRRYEDMDMPNHIRRRPMHERRGQFDIENFHRPPPPPPPRDHGPHFDIWQGEPNFNNYREPKYEFNIKPKHLRKERNIYHDKYSFLLKDETDYNNKDKDNFINDIKLVYINERKNLYEISNLPKDTFIIISNSLNKYLQYINSYKNYFIFTVKDTQDTYIFEDFIENSEETPYYVRLGISFFNKKLLKLLLGGSILFFIFILIICFIIRICKHQNVNLPISRMLARLPFFVLFINILNYISYDSFYLKSEFYFIFEYGYYIMNSFLNSLIITICVLVLLGWMTLDFSDKFKTFRKTAFFFFIADLLYSIFTEISEFFFIFAHKLALFYIKQELQFILILGFSIFSFVSRYIELKKQTEFEKRIRSDFAKACRLKQRMLFWIIFSCLILSITFIIFPIIEYNYSFKYNENMQIHRFIEGTLDFLFLIILNIIFRRRKFPRLFLESTTFYYKDKTFLASNLNDEKENLKRGKFNMEKLLKIRNKENYPIMVLNPFFNNKNVFNDVHIGYLNN